MTTLFSVAWNNKYLCGFFALQTLAWIGADEVFGNTWQQVLPWQHFFPFLGCAYKSF